MCINVYSTLFINNCFYMPVFFILYQPMKSWRLFPTSLSYSLPPSITPYYVTLESRPAVYRLSLDNMACLNLKIATFKNLFTFLYCSLPPLQYQPLQHSVLFTFYNTLGCCQRTIRKLVLPWTPKKLIFFPASPVTVGGHNLAVAPKNQRLCCPIWWIPGTCEYLNLNAIKLEILFLSHTSHSSSAH